MEKLLKPGTTHALKIRSAVNLFQIGLGLAALFMAQMACAQDYISMPELTATARALLVPVLPSPTPVKPSETPGVTPATPTVVLSLTPQPTPTRVAFTPTATWTQVWMPAPSKTQVVTTAVVVVRSPVVARATETASQTLPPPPTQTLALPSPSATAPRPTWTATPLPPATLTVVRVTPVPATATLAYSAQSGDSVPVLAVRFGVKTDEMISKDPLPKNGLIKLGQVIYFPLRFRNTTSAALLLPDSEVVYSPSLGGSFDMKVFVDRAGGYLSTYREYLVSGWRSGAEVIKQVALENSINPRLLLALLEYNSHWVYSQPSNLAENDYPMGWMDMNRQGLYKQMNTAAQQLFIGYYGWRSGKLTELVFADGTHLRLAPQLNAGTVALMYYFSKIYTQEQWDNALYRTPSPLLISDQMFGDKWARAAKVEPLFADGLEQPVLELPFQPGHTWNYTGGPHHAWAAEGPWAALDFAPIGVKNCNESNEKVLASAAGVIVRLDKGVVILDLDGDGREETGWVLLYLHIADKEHLFVGQVLNVNDYIGHPSCEGGSATGTHIHIARKYNGEWVVADSALPFVMSGWRAHAGDKIYEGSLSKNDQIIQAKIYSSFESRITRPQPKP